MLEGQTLAVGELCDILQLPQSTISRHLKTLTDGGWSQVRREGTSRLYSFVTEDLDAASADLWRVVKAQLVTMAAVAQDRVRLTRVLAQRRTESAAFFSRTAGEWDDVRDDLYGSTFHLDGLLAACDPSWTVADLGCGTGRTAAALAPFVRRVVAVDASAEMLAAARERLQGVPNVDVREGTLEAVPVADGTVDLALLVLVLHHLGDPAAVLKEARRVLAPGGRRARDRHAAARPRGVSWPDGPCLARVLRAADWPAPRRAPASTGRGWCRCPRRRACVARPCSSPGPPPGSSPSSVSVGTVASPSGR